MLYYCWWRQWDEYAQGVFFFVGWFVCVCFFESKQIHFILLISNWPNIIGICLKIWGLAEEIDVLASVSDPIRLSPNINHKITKIVFKKASYKNQ